MKNKEKVLKPKPTEKPEHSPEHPVADRLDTAVDPENTGNLVQTDSETADQNNQEVYDIPMGKDLDVPGAELDDANEDIGSEDEENNYYSLGGDNHDD